jgi:hypothetical protein
VSHDQLLSYGPPKGGEAYEPAISADFQIHEIRIAGALRLGLTGELGLASAPMVDDRLTRLRVRLAHRTAAALEPHGAVLPIMGHQGSPGERHDRQRSRPCLRPPARHLARDQTEKADHRDDASGSAMMTTLTLDPHAAVASVIFDEIQISERTTQPDYTSVLNIDG